MNAPSREAALTMDTVQRNGPPAWLIAATGLLGIGVLAMAVAETTLWLHYLIDAGESISLVGLAFILVAGVYLFTRSRLLVSLPLAVPWLLFPVITQGDQIIDNLSINWMRFIVHVLLALIFGTPVAVLVMAARYAVAPAPTAAPRRVPAWLAIVPGIPQLAAGRIREGNALLAVMLLVVEIWIAVRFLGMLMVITLALMIWGVLIHASASPDTPEPASRRRGERFALGLLISGVVLSVGLFFGFKNRPGAYQGSPSYYMDPSQKNAGFNLDRIAVPQEPPGPLTDPEGVRNALTLYARSFERLLAGYYILDRNYNYDFHNRLFLRNTPVLTDYRAAGLAKIAEAERISSDAALAAHHVRPSLASNAPMAALLDDVEAYAEFTFGRVPTLEKMSAGFEQTQAGLQHATHLFEGEGKVMGVQLNGVLIKHSRVLSSPEVAPVTSEFATISHGVYEKYANRVVGF